ncbi:MAG: VPLPA-CTERM sorting domain-containing protein, partial [Pseudomonadota bacterium]|nr:VPLPA-CTERM sorting domain-containing protein [Pseudomonadota bacterium]
SRPPSYFGSRDTGDFYVFLGGDLSRGKVLTGTCVRYLGIPLSTRVDINGGGVSYLDPCTSNVIVSAYTPPTTGAPAVPLPASLPLLLAGVAGMGALSRRRKG